VFACNCSRSELLFQLIVSRLLSEQTVSVALFEALLLLAFTAEWATSPEGLVSVSATVLFRYVAIAFTFALATLVHHLDSPAIHLEGGLFLGLFHLHGAESLHSCLALGFKLLRVESTLGLLLHRSEPLHTLLLLRIHRFLRLNAKALLSLLDAYLTELLGHDAEALSPRQLLRLGLLKQLHGLEGCCGPSKG